MLDFSILNSFISAGIVNQVLFIILIVASVATWGMIFYKIKQIYYTYKAIGAIDELLNSPNSTLIESYIVQNSNPYVSMLEFVVKNYNTISHTEMKEKCKTILDKNTLTIGENMGYLAVVSNAAPFVGLLGTVLGVINSFQQIGISGSASLLTIAPGIAEALYATALGLFVAVPASIAYNAMIMNLEQIENKENALIDKIVFILSIK